jgi:hypothetical protein
MCLFTRNRNMSLDFNFDFVLVEKNYQKLLVKAKTKSFFDIFRYFLMKVFWVYLTKQGLRYVPEISVKLRGFKETLSYYYQHYSMISLYIRILSIFFSVLLTCIHACTLFLCSSIVQIHLLFILSSLFILTMYYLSRIL